MCGVPDISFEPDVGESNPFASLIALGMSKCAVNTSMRATFFTPTNLPSLRLFSSDILLHDHDFLTYPSPLFAADLHHLSLYRDALSLLLATHQLRSLNYFAKEGLPVPNDHRFGTPLVAIRLRTYASWGVGQELLESGVKSGLIDSGTVVFFPDIAESAAESGRWKTWCVSHGMRVEWKDGALERDWCSDDSRIDEHRDFAS